MDELDRLAAEQDQIDAEEAALIRHHERVDAHYGCFQAIPDRVEVAEPQRSTVPEGRYLTVSECARYLGRSAKAVRRLVERGELPCVRLGRRLQFDRVALDRWVARHSVRGKRIG
jgi:excisionase family DNA binding protein